MVNNKADFTELEKLVDNVPLVSYDISVPQRLPTKKRIRRIADPHIRAHQVKGKQYYYYCRGTDKEIYLGDAETILRKVRVK